MSMELERSRVAGGYSLNMHAEKMQGGVGPKSIEPLQRHDSDSILSALRSPSPHLQ